jgi:three-Cys-motif partner protein
MCPWVSPRSPFGAGVMAESPVYGTDGFIARPAGEYSRKKLAFLRLYFPPAIDATQQKRRRIYVDLFAGPGLNVIRGSGEEFESGALTALRSCGYSRTDLAFTDAHLVNLEEVDHDAIESRIGVLVQSGHCRVPPNGIHCHQGDCNTVLPKILRDANLRDYLLVFADAEAPRQLPWSTVSALRASGHESIDLYLLLPLEMGLNRLTSYGEMAEGHADIISAFYGGDDWRPILKERVTGARSQECKRRLEELYLQKLQSLWGHAIKVMDVRLAGQQGLYRMLFATDHEAGIKIAKWAQEKAEGSDQLGLGPGF